MTTRRQAAVWTLAALALCARAAAAPVFVEFGSSMRMSANDSDPGINGIEWTVPGYDDSGWATGTYGAGYENGVGAENLIQTPVPSGTQSIYTRVVFDVADISAITSLQLGVDYDDGWIAWLNGVEVGRAGDFPAGVPQWDTETNDQHESSNGLLPSYEPFVDITAIGVPLLQTTGNVLAIGVWNYWPGSSDLVLVPKLEANPAIGVIRGPYLQLATADSVYVRWRTNAAEESVVRFGPRPGDLSMSVADPASVTEHVVQLTGLSPATRYYYSVGTSADARAGGDDDHYFRTPPLIGMDAPLRVWAIGDSGTANADARRVRDAYLLESAGRETDLWLMLGDNAYQDGTDSEYQSAVFNTYPSLLRTSVVWPTFGNHDGYTSDSTNQIGPYFDMFTLPAGAEAGGIPSGTEAYYSYDYGNVHFICLDSNEHSTSNAMETWLQADLADTTQDWVIAYFHHAPYNKGSHDSDSESRLINMRENFAPLLEAGGVDLVLSGHSHSYERSYLIDGHYGDSGTFVPAYLVDGGDGRVGGDGAYTKPDGGPAANAGAVYTVAGSSGKTDSGGPFNHPAMYVAHLRLGSVVLEINCNRLDATFLDDAGVVRDEYTVLKGAALPPLAPADLMATANATTIDLVWTDNADNEQGFALERSLDGIVWTFVTNLPADAVSYSDTGLMPMQDYWYRLRAFNAACPSAWSAVASATTGGCNIPGEVGNTLLMVKAMSDITAYWTDIVDATSYNLYEKTVKSDPFATLTGSAPSGGPGLTVPWPAGARLFYRVVGANPCGEGP